MKRFCWLLIVVSATTLKAQDKSKQNFIFNGVNAATYTNISIDKGSVEGRDMSNLRLLVGIQVWRFWDIASLSLGFGKVGFYDAVYEWGDSSSDSFQFNYQGPTIGLVLVPNWYVSFEAMYWYAPSGKGRRTINPTDHQEFEYDVSETTIYAGFRIWDQLKFIVGLGQRTLKGSSRGFRDNVENSAVAAATNFSNSGGSYILVGVQGTQLMTH